MKKVFGLLLGFLCVIALSLSLVPVQAEETEDVVLIYVEAPQGWESPHVWAWDDDGAGAFANLGWPGKAMVEDEANAGWFYLYVPATMTNVIINANEGAVQTEGFSISGENVWVTVTEAEGVFTSTTSTVQATQGNLPEYVATKYIYAYVPIDWDTAGIWAWNNASGTGVFTTWPGQEMTLLDDGWFMYEIPDTADRVIINNYNTENGVQTVDLTVATEDVYILLDDEANDSGKFEATISSEKPVIIEDGITLYITVPETWEAPCLWAWSHPDGTNVYTTWPGQAISYDEESGYYVVEVPNWVNRIIINNGSTGDDAQQSIDTELDTTSNKYVYVGEANEEGKLLLTVYTEPLETGNNNTVVYIVAGAAVLLLAAGAGLYFSKKKKA